MGGLFGIVGTSPADQVCSRFKSAYEAMLRRNCRVTSSLSAQESTWLFAQFESVLLSTPEAPFERPSGPSALFHGVLHNVPDLLRTLQLSANRLQDSIAVVLGQLYLRYGDRFVDHLDGEFCVAIIDPDRHRVLIATDAIGSHPLYWHANSLGLTFSSTLSALLRATPSNRRLDLRAVADYITLGSLLADRTLVRDVSLLPPGTLLQYNAQTQSVSCRRYVDVSTFFQEKYLSKATYLEAVEAEFTCAVNRALASARPVGLALSGGLDSRAILSALRDRAPSVQTYTLGIDGCADQIIASKLASVAGTQHRFFCLNQSYLRDFLPNMARMVSLTDGMYLSHGLTEMLALQFLRETGIEVLLRGHGGELAKVRLAWPLHTDETVYHLKSVEDLVPYLSKRANYITGGLPLSELLLPHASRAAGDGSRSAFRDLLSGTMLSPPECCSYLYLELTRRFTIPSVELFRTLVEVRLPFLDRRFLEVLLAAPPEWRDGTEIHRRLIAAGIPRLLSVRNSNTGAAADASRAKEYVLDKCNSLLKRLNFRGFRHYHNFDAWMRTMLLESVESELLTSDAKVQAFIGKAALAKLIQDTRQGTSDRSYLLQVLLILELWQRENGVEASV